MVDYREILRRANQQNSQRSIAASVHCSRHTVSDVLSAAAEKDIRWPQESDVSNEELERILFPEKHQASNRYAEPDYAAIHRELAKPGVTMTLLWEEYRAKRYENGQTPYQSTQFGEKYRRWARVTKATMRTQHKPGDAMEVDWAGDTIPVFDPVTGEEDAAYLFIAVLPCSCMVYAEPCLDMKTENVIERLNREIHRRTRVVGCFPDGNSALMLVCARLRHVAGTQWGCKKYMNMKHLETILEDVSIVG